MEIYRTVKRDFVFKAPANQRQQQHLRAEWQTGAVRWDAVSRHK
jgi:hypothetical protein